MTSQHDILTAVITIVTLILTGVLVVTHNANGAIATGILAGLGMLFTYWFTRGGSQMSSSQSVQATPQPVVLANTQPDVEAVTNAVLDKLAQTPATDANTNQGTLSK